MMGGDELTEMAQDDTVSYDDDPPMEWEEFDFSESGNLIASVAVHPA